MPHCPGSHRACYLLLGFLLSACANEPPKQRAPRAEESAVENKVLTMPAMQAAQRVMADAANYAPLPPPRGVMPQSRERYLVTPENVLMLASEQPVSTFSIDVDTGSYTNVRRMLNQGQLPPADAVRAEDFINYFSYAYPAPTEGKVFSINTELAVSPWNAKRHLLKIGLQGQMRDKEQRKAANLVFLLDVSGSMNAPEKLPLLISSLRLLTSQLDHRDRVSIVTYAGRSETLLEPTPGDQHGRIQMALDSLSAGGGTYGEGGILQAYQLARTSFIKQGVNRVILATDGDFNVGMSDLDGLKALIRRQRESGVALTTLGFGSGNYNDAMMESLSNLGNGQHAYIDSINEARKVLVDELSSSMEIIASDVKIQVEFNPALVSEYRLVGYYNRLLDREDFNNDKVDAGEIGAGHSVTAIYEIALAGSGGEQLEPLRYQQRAKKTDFANELAQIKLRYKLPLAQKSQLITDIVTAEQLSSKDVQDDFAFVAAVAGFAQQLKGGKYMQDSDYQTLIALAQRGIGSDPQGYRHEFINLLKSAALLSQTSGLFE
ncbi:vWA domain-containing protein [Bowmanella pacifica]|uniref:VWFA domain-containing protein n=1 Tax=Bowmanella pacifica TaxID=502051 RepID=A0A917Z1X4_9ALTE|nr:VWA domain-containing protein [Bowmanella pacifica]GGO72805.1 hypothetical protein GCM10010982_31840 [Bowmanella pacifica]